MAIGIIREVRSLDAEGAEVRSMTTRARIGFGLSPNGKCLLIIALGN